MPVSGSRVRAGVLVLGAVILAVSPAVPAAAAPAIPSEDQVRQARSAAAAKAAEVSRITARLAAAEAEAEEAAMALSEAAEDYNEARLELERAAQAAAAAHSAAAAARAGLAEARREVGRIASQKYRQGGVSAIGVLLDADGPDAVLERASLLGAVGDAQGLAMERMSARRLVTTSLEAHAATTREAQRAAAERLEEARQRAERQSRDATAVATRVATEQESLAAQLVTLQATSTQLAQQRRAGLEAQRQARIAAAAKARAEAERRARADAARADAQQRRSSQGSNTGRSNESSRSTGGSVRQAPTSPGTSRGSSSAGAGAVAWARSRVGLPYQWGGAGPYSYDCSGLTMRAWQSAGVGLPHSSRAQYASVRKVSYSSMRMGDLIFWGRSTSDPSSIYHVAIYAGGGLMVEAPRTGLDVRVVPVRWTRAMPYAGRP